MLKFFIFKGDQPASDRVMRHVHLLGPESLPIPGEITTSDGLVECKKGNNEAAGLSIQVGLDVETLEEMGGPAAFEDVLGNGRPVTPLGIVTLRTCLLPERDEPYLLSLELARHRIMLFLNKLEEWQLDAIDPESDVMRLFEAARRAFTGALVRQRSGAKEAHGFSPEAHNEAIKALWLAVEASERLALLDASRSFEPRVTGKAYEHAAEHTPYAPSSQQRAPVLSPDRPGLALPSRPMVGSAVDVRSFSEPAAETAAASLDYIQVPMRWVEMEPSEGTYSFKLSDRWIEWAVRKARMPVAGGPIIDFRPASIPEWLYIWENDYETLRDLVSEHVKTLVTRYRRTVNRWTVVSGIHANENFHLSFDQMLDLSRLTVTVIRKLHPTARVIVELTHPWGEYHTANRRSLPPIIFAEMVNQAGIGVDGFALRVQMGQPARGQSTRDLMALSDMLDRYATLDRPLSINAAGVPSGMPESVGSPELADMHPGFWRGPWNESRQAAWASAALAVAVSKPYVESVCWQELTDSPRSAEMPRGGIITEAGAAKEAATALRELREAVRAAKAPENLAGDALLSPVPSA